MTHTYPHKYNYHRRYRIFFRHLNPSLIWNKRQKLKAIKKPFNHKILITYVIHNNSFLLFVLRVVDNLYFLLLIRLSNAHSYTHIKIYSNRRYVFCNFYWIEKEEPSNTHLWHHIIMFCCAMLKILATYMRALCVLHSL